MAALTVSGQASLKPDSTVEMPWMLAGPYKRRMTEMVVLPARQHQ